MKKVAVITGGSRGIGAACAVLLAQEGYSVIVLSRSKSELIQRHRDEGLDICWMACDVSSAEQVQQVFSDISRIYHRIDLLVNNAGISMIKLFSDTTEQDWGRVIETNLGGAYRCCRAALPLMLSHRSGSIINISSMWGEVGASCEVAYSVSKAGLIGLTKSLAKELAPSGIRVNCVTPGVIDTEMNSELDEMTLDSLREETPLGRIGTVEDVAKAVHFLAGEEASFITGQILGVNGGLVM